MKEIIAVAQEILQLAPEASPSAVAAREQCTELLDDFQYEVSCTCTDER